MSTHPGKPTLSDSLFDSTIREIIANPDVSSKLRRQRIINEILRVRGQVSFQQFSQVISENERELNIIQDKDPRRVRDVNRKQFAEDIAEVKFLTGAFLNNIGDGVYVADEKKYETTRELRSNHQKEAKSIIARLAGGLLLGDRQRYVAESYEVPPHTRNQILGKLKETNIDPNVREKYCWFVKQLTTFVWGAYQRMVGCDAGTTTLALCSEVIAKVMTPRGGLNRLFVCTNSRHIFNEIGQPSVRTKAIIVGGSQHYQTEAISGWMSQRFMEAANIRFCMSFVGATAVDLRNGVLGADHDNDCIIKNEFLCRAELKVVLADHSKFRFGAYSAFMPFSTISPDTVDLIVTDRIWKNHLGQLNRMGILVLADKIEEEEISDPEIEIDETQSHNSLVSYRVEEERMIQELGSTWSPSI